MELLKKRILEQGEVFSEEIIKVDGFLNHRIDCELMDEIAEEFAQRFANEKIDMILTVEASGIAVAYPLARKLNIPMIFAKKGKAKNIGEEYYSADVHSFTRGTTYGVYVSKKYLKEHDRVLLIDDFLANGQASLGLISICEQAKAIPVAIGIVIEKHWQRGSELVRKKGIRLESLAVIESMQDGMIEFYEET